MTDRPDDLDTEPDEAPWCCNGNAEDCALCTDPNPPYPFLCLGHDDTSENRAALAAPSEPASQDLRDRIAHAIAADDGHPWGTLCEDTQQHYLDNADAVLAVHADLAVEVATLHTVHDDRDLRTRLDAAIDDVFTRWQAGLGGQRPQDAIRDAVLAVLPAVHRLFDAQAGEAQQPADGGALKRAHVALAGQSGRDQAAIARVRAVADAIDTEMRTEPDTQQAAMQMEAVTRIRAALDGHPLVDGPAQQRPARPDGVVDDALAAAFDESRRITLAALADTLLALLPEHADRDALLHAAAERLEAERGRRCWEADVLRGVAGEQQAGEGR